MIKNIKNFKKLNIIGFLPYKNFNDDINNIKKTKISYKIIRSLNQNLIKESEILISSYEFCYDIERELKIKYSNIKMFKYYNGYSCW